MDKKETDKLIDRYYDAETSLDEEKLLLKHLLSCSSLDEKESEALAVMVYSKKAVKKPAMRNKRRKILKYAAVVALMAVGAYGVKLLAGLPNSDHHSECLAYVDGNRIESERVVMSLVHSQLEEMSEASSGIRNEIECDLSEIRNALITE